MCVLEMNSKMSGMGNMKANLDIRAYLIRTLNVLVNLVVV
jgi:hypothetical protein